MPWLGHGGIHEIQKYANIFFPEAFPGDLFFV